MYHTIQVFSTRCAIARAHTPPRLYIETHHHHVPNEGIAHIAVAPAQAPAQPEAVLGIAQHTQVGDPAPQVVGEEGVVQVRPHPRRRNEVPPPPPGGRRPGIFRPHGRERPGGGGRRVVVPVQVYVQDVQVGVDLRLARHMRERRGAMQKKTMKKLSEGSIVRVTSHANSNVSIRSGERWGGIQTSARTIWTTTNGLSPRRWYSLPRTGHSLKCRRDNVDDDAIEMMRR
jgi:hypothetical protein